MLTNSEVLVIEDNQPLANIMHKVLTRRGARVSCASSARMGLEMISELLPDLIVCDYNLPDGTASQFLPKFRQLHPAVKILVCSGEPLVQFGWDDYLPKPFTMEQLVGSLAALRLDLRQPPQPTAA